MLNSFILKNGLKVATFSIPQMRSVFLSLAVKGGSIFDKKESLGTAHFMEHMLVQGIPSLPDVESFSDYIEGLAGSYNAGTSAQMIRLMINAPSIHLEDLSKIASEVFFQPLFPEDALKRERNAVLEEIRERQDSLMYKIGRFFAQVRYGENHPMAWDNSGTIETVSQISRTQLLDYWANFFYPKNTCLVVVGGLKGDIRTLVNDYFGKYNSHQSFPGFPHLTNENLSDRTVAIREDPNLKTCYLDLTFPSVCNDHPLEDRIKQQLIRSILGGLRRSRLFRLLRQRRGLVYHVGFGSAVFQHFGYGYISSQVSLEKLDEVLELIIRELSAFIVNGPTEEELEFAKNHHINQVLMQWDHPSAISEWIADDLMWEKKIYTPEDYAKMAERVEVKDLRYFVKKYWDFAKLNLVIQGSVEDSKENIKKYEKMLKELR